MYKFRGGDVVAVQTAAINKSMDPPAAVPTWQLLSVHKNHSTARCTVATSLMFKKSTEDGATVFGALQGDSPALFYPAEYLAVFAKRLNKKNEFVLTQTQQQFLDTLLATSGSKDQEIRVPEGIVKVSPLHLLDVNGQLQTLKDDRDDEGGKEKSSSVPPPPDEEEKLSRTSTPQASSRPSPAEQPTPTEPPACSQQEAQAQEPEEEAHRPLDDEDAFAASDDDPDLGEDDSVPSFIAQALEQQAQLEQEHRLKASASMLCRNTNETLQGLLKKASDSAAVLNMANRQVGGDDSSQSNPPTTRTPGKGTPNRRSSKSAFGSSTSRWSEHVTVIGEMTYHGNPTPVSSRILPSPNISGTPRGQNDGRHTLQSPAMARDGGHSDPEQCRAESQDPLEMLTQSGIRSASPARGAFGGSTINYGSLGIKNASFGGSAF